jgi:hypothetical protein
VEDVTPKKKGLKKTPKKDFYFYFLKKDKERV